MIIIALVLFTLLCLALGMDHAWSTETSTTRNAIVFEDRNRDYGAYRLREEYGQRMIWAFMAAMGSAALVVATLSWAMRSVPIGIAMAPRPVVVDVDLSRLITPPPLPPSSTPKAAAVLPPKQKDPLVPHFVQATDKIVEPPEAPVDTGAYLATGAAAGGTTDGKEPSTDKVLGNGTDLGTTTWDNFEVQEVPEFPGGNAGLGDWVRRHLDFPEDASGKDVVYVQFTVALDGSVEDVKAVKGKEEAYKRAAERAVRRMPRWKPARMNGNDVRCRLTLPIKFETR